MRPESEIAADNGFDIAQDDVFNVKLFDRNDVSRGSTAWPWIGYAKQQEEGVLVFFPGITGHGTFQEFAVVPKNER